MLFPLCLLLLSCTTRGNIAPPYRPCFQAGIHIPCEDIPQTDDDEERDEEYYSDVDFKQA